MLAVSSIVAAGAEVQPCQLGWAQWLSAPVQILCQRICSDPKGELRSSVASSNPDAEVSRRVMVLKSSKESVKSAIKGYVRVTTLKTYAQTG